MVKDRTAAAIGATLLAAVLWGTSFNVNDIGLRVVSPATFVVLRFALAGLVLIAALIAMRRFDASLPRQPFFWALALANGVAFLLQYYGQTFTTPARTALFVNASAFIVAILERFVFQQRLGLPRILAIFVGVGGAGLLIAGRDEGLAGGRWIGDLLTLASGAVWSVYFVMNQRAVQRHDPWSVTAWVFILTALLMTPFLLLDAAPLVVPWEGAWTVAYAGIVTTAFAFGLWSFGLRRLRASASAVLLLVEILVATIVSVSIGRESFGAIELAGALLLVSAVVGMSVIEEQRAST